MIFYWEQIFILYLCKFHIIFEFSTLIFVTASSDFCFAIFKNEALIFVQNNLKTAEKFSCESLVKTGKILYNVYIVNNNGTKYALWRLHLNVQIPL